MDPAEEAELNRRAKVLIEFESLGTLNRLRLQYPDWQPCLKGVNLRWVNLSKFDLTGCSGILKYPERIGSEERFVYAVDHSIGARRIIMIQAGCWWGSLSHLRKRIRLKTGEHGWPEDKAPQYYDEYQAAIKWFEKQARELGWGNQRTTRST